MKAEGTDFVVKLILISITVAFVGGIGFSIGGSAGAILAGGGWFCYTIHKWNKDGLSNW